MSQSIAGGSTPHHLQSVVMIVDDDISARMQLKFTLENQGLTIIEAASGQEAIDLFRRNPVDLVLLDVIMPDMDGFETCREIRKLPIGTHMPVVMVTGLEDAETITRAFDAGATDFIGKPINLLIIGYRVRYWLRSGAILNELQISRKRLFQAQDIARLGHWEKNLENEEFKFTCQHPEIFGFTGQCDYNALFSSIVPREREQVRKQIADACRAEADFSVQYRITLQDGGERIILNQGEVVRRDIPRSKYAIGIIQDITELKQAEDELKKSEEKYRNILESIEEGYFEASLDGVVTFCNEYMCRMWGYAKDAFIGMSYKQLTDEVNAEMIFRTFSQVYETGHPVKGANWVIIRNDGTKGYIETFVSLVKDDLNNPVGFRGVTHDITEKIQAEDKIRYLAFYDNLTGLANRALFREHWLRAVPLSERDKRKAAIFFIGLDQFKRINETMGYQFGDKALIMIADRLKSILRHSDIISRSDKKTPSSLISRVGGDEFTVLATNLETTNHIVKLAERLVEALSLPLQVENEAIILTASIGVSVYPDDSRDIDTLLKNADTAMYEAKNKGRNNYQFFQSTMNDAAKARFHMNNNLRKALDNGEFVLYYQPQFSNHHGGLTGVEALIRWVDPAKGLIPPDHFLPFAEESGFIHNINDWVIRAACVQAKKWVEAGMFTGCRMGLNISGNNINFEKLAANIVSVIEETGLDPCYLEVELTERVMMENTDEARIALLRLRELGVSIAIDDFGTGYSALSHLQLFPLSTLKIDKSFVRNLDTTENGLSLLTAIIGIAKGFNLKVVVEGVETEEQRVRLGTMACDELQGYLLGKPMPLEMIGECLTLPGPVATKPPPSGFRP